MIENGTLLQNRYLVERKIGTGGMGEVYLAVDKRFDNPVAIKETFYKEEEFSEAFEREARLLNALQHPVLPHVSDYFAENDSYFLVMQYIEGEDLSDILKRDGAFSLADVLRWTDQLLDALDYLHSQEPPVIHRDIKPHNLKLTPRGSIMLLDFGLAKESRKDASEVSVFGYSRTYSPLEQVQGTGTDARSDIFALGATVYHLLTGTPPINSLTRAAVIVAGNPDPLKTANELRQDITEPIANVINSALALNAEHRFISAQAMRQALSFATDEESTSVREKTAAVTASKIPGAEKLENLPGERRVENVRSSSGSPIIVELPAKATVKSRGNQKRIVWAAAAAVLFFGLTAAFYLSSGNSADGADQPIVNVNSTVGNSNRESLAESKKRATEKSASEAAKSETNSGKASQPAATAKSASNRKNQSSQNEEVVTDEEGLFEPETETEATTEDRRERRADRQTDRPIPDEMSEEEFQQIQREERQRRRQQRRANQPDPFEN